MTNPYALELDPMHASFDVFGYPFSQDIHRAKYSAGVDKDIFATFRRVADAIAIAEPQQPKRQLYADLFYDYMAAGVLVPAGRILAGAGTSNRVTLVNCFVNETLDDSMEGIIHGLRNTALTMQQGGGMGTDFSTLRPVGAYLSRTNSIASGPMPFMNTWDTMCKTIMSAGDRRGAMMGTMICTHPDVLAFIDAKKDPLLLRNFNVSVLVTDAFMSAVRNDAEWPLFFSIPPKDIALHEKYAARHFVDANGVQQYVYNVVKARELWQRIMRNTYDFAEPGVIFIDRINDLNNLQEVETIAATNPCGEQPLPPHGACNLGHINVARLVRNPFKENADFDFVGFTAAVRLAQRFLDNVIDMSAYPLPEQAEEQQLKRRIGLGITGFADALIQLGLAYDSDNALAFADKLGSVLAHAAYEASCDLAQERGKFPLWGSINWAARPMINRFQDDLREKILEHGLRNGVLLTLAPVGTTSITYGNVSSGLEPNFAFQYTRKVRRQDGGFDEHKVESFIQRFAKHCLGNQEIDRKAWVDANDITPRDHLNIQSIFQYWVDASISKTINCPEDISFEDFQQVYLDAYELGCKGCTTYRPNSVTGSILSTETTDAKKLADKNVTAALKPIERPFALEGTTFKLDWAAFEAATYVHLTRTSDGKPFELFFNSKDQRHQEWMAALSLAMTSLFRLGVDVKFILEEFLQVTSTTVGWHQGKRYDSFIALLGGTLLEHIGGEIKQSISRGERCPECKQYTMTNKGGCMTCDSCGHSKCG